MRLSRLDMGSISRRLCLRWQTTASSTLQLDYVLNSCLAFDLPCKYVSKCHNNLQTCPHPQSSLPVRAGNLPRRPHRQQQRLLHSSSIRGRSPKCQCKCQHSKMVQLSEIAFAESNSSCLLPYFGHRWVLSKELGKNSAEWQSKIFICLHQYQ